MRLRRCLIVLALDGWRRFLDRLDWLRFRSNDGAGLDDGSVALDVRDTRPWPNWMFARYLDLSGGDSESLQELAGIVNLPVRPGHVGSLVRQDASKLHAFPQ